jgi:leader peptidase (prepilin peptidase) / N-methyltransferase
MIFIFLVVIGLASGSFVNALVWRLHKQTEIGRPKSAKKHNTPSSKLQTPNFSILNGRSMCPKCEHQLKAIDLVPVISWAWLRAKCRYCKKAISWQYPLVELVTAGLFGLSWAAWPLNFASSWQYLSFITWIAILTGLIALTVYDIKWMILPDKIVYPMLIIAAVSLFVQIALGRPFNDLLGVALAAVIGGGVFWIIYQISEGKWIGGGDIKLGLLLGLLVGKPEYAFILLFLSSLLALIFVTPLMIAKKLKNNSKIPFGPFLITATIVIVLFGQQILDLYKNLSGL